MEEKSQNADEGGLSSNSALTFKEGRILVDQDLINCIFDIVKKTEKYCFIVTPFLESFANWANLEKTFDKTYNNGKKLFFLLKKPSNDSTKKNNNLNNNFFVEMEKKEKENIEITKKDFNGKFDLFLVQHLHSKIYLNEKQVLLTSINLREYSTRGNYEIGCLIDDPDFSKEIVNNIIIKEMLKDKYTQHIDGKYAEWISKVINMGEILDDVSNNNVSHLNSSNESNIDENKNDNSDFVETEEKHNNLPTNPDNEAPNTVVTINDSNLNVDDNLDNDNSSSNESSINENKNDDPDNKVIPSIETNLDENKNYSPMNNNNSSCKPSAEILENSELFTLKNLFIEILEKNNKKEELNNKELYKQFSMQMINNYKFEPKYHWPSDDKRLYWEKTKINRQMYDWALENITL